MRCIQTSIFLAAILHAQASYAKPPQPTEFGSFTVRSGSEQVPYHLDADAESTTGPLIIWLPGSGAFPFFQTFDDGSVGFTFPLALLEHRSEAHFLLVDKPGVPFVARLAFDEQQGRPIELDNTTYRFGLTKDNLVDRAVNAIRSAKRQLGKRANSLIIIGGSEGAQYAFAVANRTAANQVIVWGGNAMPQYYDFIIEQRLAAEKGEISRVEAQRRVEKVLATIRRIRASPTEVANRFEGEAYRRWVGFGPYAPVDDMLRFKGPILFMQGGNDANAPILNSDFASLAFAIAGKTNLTYRVFPDLDHHFTTPNGVSQANEVWAEAWKWLEDNAQHP